MALTIREKCLAFIQTTIESMEEGEPTADPYSVTWDVVKRAPLDDADYKKKAVCGIIDTEETKKPRIQVTENMMRVVIEFRLFINSDEEGSTRLNEVMGDLQRKLREDIQLGGNAYDIQEAGNETSLDGIYDHKVEGALFMVVHYRHQGNDPRALV